MGWTEVLHLMSLVQVWSALLFVLKKNPPGGHLILQFSNRLLKVPHAGFIHCFVDLLATSDLFTTNLKPPPQSSFIHFCSFWKFFWPVKIVKAPPPPPPTSVKIKASTNLPGYRLFIRGLVPHLKSSSESVTDFWFEDFDFILRILTFLWIQRLL